MLGNPKYFAEEPWFLDKPKSFPVDESWPPVEIQDPEPEPVPWQPPSDQDLRDVLYPIGPPLGTLRPDLTLRPPRPTNGEWVYNEMDRVWEPVPPIEDPALPEQPIGPPPGTLDRLPVEPEPLPTAPDPIVPEPMPPGPWPDMRDVISPPLPAPPPPGYLEWPDEPQPVREGPPEPPGPVVPEPPVREGPITWEDPPTLDLPEFMPYDAAFPPPFYEGYDLTPYEEFEAPEYDPSQIRGRTQEIAGAGTRALQESMTRALSGTIENPNVRRNVERGALSGYSMGLEDIMGAARGQALGEYDLEYEDLYGTEERNWETSTRNIQAQNVVGQQAAQINYQRDLMTYTQEMQRAQDATMIQYQTELQEELANYSAALQSYFQQAGQTVRIITEGG